MAEDNTSVSLLPMIQTCNIIKPQLIAAEAEAKVSPFLSCQSRSFYGTEQVLQGDKQQYRVWKKVKTCIESTCEASVYQEACLGHGVAREPNVILAADDPFYFLQPYTADKCKYEHPASLIHSLKPTVLSQN